MGKDPRKIAKIDIEIIFGTIISDKHKTVLERVAHQCPVSKTLQGNIEENVKFIYP